MKQKNYKKQEQNMKVNYTGSGKVFFQEKEYDCDLYLNEKKGGILLKIKAFLLYMMLED